MAEECILFPGSGGGMDQDTSEYSPLEEFSKGSYRYALNLRIGNTSKNQTDSGENLPSSLLVNTYLTWNGSAWVSGSPQSGTNVAVNHYEDRANGCVYWTVRNSNGHHAILKYVKSERNIYELLQWDGLNFVYTNFVSMTMINKYLLLTDGNPKGDFGVFGNPPRCIDTTTIFQLKSTLGASFSEYHLSLAKWAPLLPPNITTSASGTGSNFIKKGIFQFAYRYIFVGGFRSTWSPPSVFVTNEGICLLNTGNVYSPTPWNHTPYKFQINAPGFVYDYENPTNNGFNVLDARFYQFITQIEFAYRESETQGWKLFSRVPVSASSQPTYTTFDNNLIISQVAASDIGQYFDSVPFFSRAIEAIDNRPMLANNLDDLAPMSNFHVSNIAVYSATPDQDNWFSYLYPSASDPQSINKKTFKEGGVYKLGMLLQHFTGRTWLVHTQDDWVYTIPESDPSNQRSVEAFHALGFTLDDVQPPATAVAYQIVRSNCLNIDYFIKGVANDFRFLKVDTSSIDPTITSDAIKAAISDYYDSFNSGSGATYSLSARLLAVIRKNQAASGSTTCTLIYIDIRNWFLDTVPPGTAPPSPSNNVLYNWAPGDRVKFWGCTTSGFGSPYIQYDQEIIEFTGTAIIVSKPDDFAYMGNRASIAGSGSVNPNIFIIDVYRPKKYNANEEVLFYEMGEWYPIITVGRFRHFSKLDFTWTDSSSITVTNISGNGSPGVTIFSLLNKMPIINGDVWLVQKNFFWDSIISDSNTVNRGYLGPLTHFSPIQQFQSIVDYPIFPQMTQDKYRAADVWEHNTGRPFAAYEYLPVQFEKSTQIRFGGKFLEDSIFIGINNFQDDNQKIYPSEYGPIRALVNTSNTQVKDVGQILMAICEEETMDIYVNRATLQQLGGQTQVSLSDQVLGSYNTLLGSYGTLNPDSVSKRNSRVLFWNARRGMWIRRSIDGLTPISNYKMQNWFKDLSNLLINTYATDVKAQVISVFDPYYEEWVTFINHSSLPSTYRGYSSYKSAGFDEDSKRWNTIYDYAPDIFASLENEVYSIIGTTIHIHYAGADYGSIYGVKKDCMWQPVANREFRVTKIWRALNQQATDKWSFPSIAGDFKSNGANAQNSALLLSDLQNREGTWWSDIKRDLNTVNAPSSDQAIVNGDPMRSRALTLMLKLDPSVTWYSFINWLVVTFDRSEKTVKN